MTLGNVIVTDQAASQFSANDGLSAHERSHTDQSAAMGNDVYALVWLAGLGASLATGNYQGGGGCINPIELTAAPGGGYESCW